MVTTALLSGCSAPGQTETALLSPGAHYVAMGSSFAAGAGIGPIRPGTPERCQRTPLNYAGLLAEELQLDLDDQSCGGATTAHLLGPWDELPAQIDAVTADTQLVTVTIGGNDINYIGRLFMASCPARDLAESFGVKDCPPVTAPTVEDYARLASDMHAVAAAVQERAPEATLVFVQYVGLVPELACADTPLTAEQLGMFREMAERLAEITAAAARDSGSLLLEVDDLSARHLPCSAEPWAVGFPEDFNHSLGAPWHPNTAGHRAIATELANLLQH